MELLPKAYEYLLSGLSKSKSAANAKKEIGSAIDNEIGLLWKKVRPILIKEDPKLINQLEQKDLDDTITGGFKYLLSRKLEEDEFASMIETDLKKLIALEKADSSKRKIVNTSVVGKDNVTIVDSKVKGFKFKP